MRLHNVIRAGAWLPLSLWAVLHDKAAADDYDAEARELEHVQVTATRRAVRDFDVSAAVTQVDEVSVRAEIPDVLAEILRGLPGTFFQQTTPGQGIPIIRGLKGSQVLHLVDGMRLNNAFFRDAPNQYLGLVDAFAVERVEVVRGAAGSLYGADAMGGVVNVLTPEPRFEGNQWQWGGAIYGAFSSVDEGWIGRASTEGGRDGMTFTAGATWQDRGDRRIGGGDRFHPSGYRSEAVDLKFISDVGTSGALMLSAQVLEQPQTPRVDELVPGYDQEQPSSERYDFQPNRRGFLHARYRHRSDSRWFEQVEINLAQQTITDDRISQDFGSTELTRQNNESVLDGLTFQFDSTLSGGHLLTWGGEYYRDKISSSRARRDTETGQEGEVRSRFPDGSTMDSMAVFARADWTLPGRLSLGTGLRYSAFDIRLPASDFLPDVRLSPSDLTGDLNLLFALSEEVHLVANFGRGFRPPNIFDLATLGPRPGNRFNIPNPDLGPESVWSYDAGLKFYHSDWEFELFGFYLDYRDKITSVDTGAMTPEGRTVVRGENRNQMVIYGVESGVRWTVSENFEVYGVLNYTRGEEEDDDGASDNGDRIPPLNGRLGLRYQPIGRWSLEGYWSFADAQDRLSERDIGDPRIDPEGTAGWGILNLLASWQASDFITLGLKLENLGDVRYREHGSGIDAPGRNIGLWIEAIW
jgi:outer membrane receptor protein involved in Fe transport